MLDEPALTTRIASIYVASYVASGAKAARRGQEPPVALPRAAQNSSTATSQHAVKSQRFPGHPGKHRTPSRTTKSAKKADTPQTRTRLMCRAL